MAVKGVSQLVSRLRSPSRVPGEFMITNEGAQKLVEDFIRDVAGWPPHRPIRDAPQPSKVEHIEYYLGFIPDIASHTNPQSGLSVIWWEPHVQGGCWCSDAGEDVKPTIWWPLPKITP